MNSRFKYAIDYPKNWPVGKESVNGDGIALYEDKPNNEILVYGSNIPSTFSTQNTPVERNIIILDDGIQATNLKYKDETGKVVYIVYFNQNNQQYTFYATVTEQFFNNNEQTLQSVAKSFKVI